MKPSLPLVLVAVVVGVQEIGADALFGPGRISGRVGYDYIGTESSYENAKVSSSTFLQNYALGYASYVYHPKLVSYSLSTGVTLSDSKSVRGEGEASESKLEGVNYNANVSLLSGTKIPITVYAQKNSNPYEFTQSNQTFLTANTSSSFGINGVIALPAYTITYGMNQNDSHSESIQMDEKRKEDTYTLGLVKPIENGSLRLTAVERAREYMRNDKLFGTAVDWSDRIREIRADGRWTPNKDVSLSSYGNYTSNSSVSMNTLNAGVTANWRVSDKLLLNSGLMGSSMSASGSQTDSVSLNVGSSYRVSDTIASTQQVNLYKMASSGTSMTMETVAVGASYSKPLENNKHFSLAGTVTGLGQQMEGKDVNATTSANVTSLQYAINTNVSKFYAPYNTRISAGANYSTSTSSNGAENNRYSFTASLNATPMKNLVYQLKANYSQDEILSVVSNREEYRNYEMLGIDNSLRYSGLIGMDGQYSANIGIWYTASKNGDLNSSRFERINPHANATLSYQLLRWLQLTSNASIANDLVYDIINYSVNMGLNARVRALIMSAGASYSYQQGGPLRDTSQQNIYFKISRGF